jgi:hypothetical protein
MSFIGCLSPNPLTVRLIGGYRFPPEIIATLSARMPGCGSKVVHSDLSTDYQHSPVRKHRRRVPCSNSFRPLPTARPAEVSLATGGASAAKRAGGRRSRLAVAH